MSDHPQHEHSAAAALLDDASPHIRRVTWAGLWANLALAAAKFAGGVYGSSQAVIADAVHSVSDISTDAAILIGVHYWNKPADESHPHGHRRIETLVTLGIGVVLIAVATGMIWNAVKGLHADGNPPPRRIALAVALLSIVTKEVLYRWTTAVGRRYKAGALLANAWHHRSDALSSIPAAVAVAGAAISPAWAFLDPVGAIVVSLLIYQAGYRIVRPAFSKLIDTSVSDEELQQMQRITEGTPGVIRAHRIRTRYSGCSNLDVDLHVEVDPDMTVYRGHEISEAVKRRLLEEGPGIVDVVVHLEPYQPEHDFRAGMER